MESKEKRQINIDLCFIAAGILISLVLFVPFLINGKDSIITYHDQLDGEILTYILNAKYLFKNVSSFPELMNGIPRQGLTPPAPLFVLLFKLVNPFTAVMIMEFIIKVVAFLSMFLLLRKCKVVNILAFAVAAAFMTIPFYVVYGFCIPAMPALIYAYLSLMESENIKKSILPVMVIIAYALTSSLALCGFGIVIVAVVFTVVLLIKNKGKAISVCTGTIALLLTYALTNISLIKQLLGIGENFVSHKTEIIAYPTNISDGIKEIFLHGMAYADGGHMYILPVLSIMVILVILFAEKIDKKAAIVSLSLLLSNIAIAVLVAIYQSGVVSELRNSSAGVFRTFNFSRIGWMSPCIWFVCFALLAECLYRSVQKKYLKVILLSVAGLSLMVTSLFNVYRSDFKANVMKIIKGDEYRMLTWNQFYAEDMFDRVEELIGLPKEDYRVVSLGIYPAAATYNGFYCLDAYSNNYDVDYKHEFRKVIAPELEKSEYLTEWYDGWGNRCYLMLAETNNYFTFYKHETPYVVSVDIDTDALKEMGCEYIISAAYIADENLNVELVSEDPVESDGSWYRLWVYRIK